MTFFLFPSDRQTSALLASAEDGPVHMLNMLRFNEFAAYPTDHPNAGKGLTGADAYALYGEGSAPIFKRVGGSIIHSWVPEVLVIGPEDEQWDRIFVACYPSKSSIIAMFRDPSYQKLVPHRTAALKTSRLIRMKPMEIHQRFSE
ncbi:MAG: DUF1330 domain-containing protein [Pseudomonadota bacterium]